jgi:oligoendopeptidase F
LDDLRWRLEDIYSDRQHWEQDFTGAKKQLTGIVSYRGRLGDGGTVLLQALQARARLLETCTRIYNYASMLFDGDTTNPAAQELRDRVVSLNTEASTAISFMNPEILALPEKTVYSFLNREPGLGVYRFELEDLLRYRPHTLTPSEEEIVARAGETLQAPDQIRGRPATAGYQGQLLGIDAEQ